MKKNKNKTKYVKKDTYYFCINIIKIRQRSKKGKVAQVNWKGLNIIGISMKTRNNLKEKIQSKDEYHITE